MLETILEYRKGILFVRLFGSLTKNTTVTFKTKITSLVLENNINHIVLNLESVDEIDLKGIHEIYYLYEICKDNKGKLLLCNSIHEDVKRKLRKERLFHYIKEIKNELVAFDMVQI